MKRKLFTHVCNYCNVSFQRNKKRVEGQNIFCSIDHSRLGQKRRSGKPYSLSKEYPSSKKCEVCNKLFLANNSQNLYCSGLCRYSARNARTKEKWKNRQVIGITFEKNTRYAVKLNLIEKVKTCPICSDSFTEMNIKSIHLDHNHKNGKVRGILCFRCNAGLGQFRDSIESLKAAIKYLEDHE